jgi:hypothetical protein
MSENPSSPPSGWYPDPAGGVGLRYWDGAAWTERTEPTPTALESPLAAAEDYESGATWSPRRRSHRRTPDRGCRSAQLRDEAPHGDRLRLRGRDAQLHAGDGRHFDRLPPDGPRSDREWFALYDHIHETAAASYFELTYRRARVEAVFVAPWHRNAVEAKRRYLEHNIAWSDELDAVAATLQDFSNRSRMTSVRRGRSRRSRCATRYRRPTFWGSART